MIGESDISKNGLFGGLLAELKLDTPALINEINASWECSGIVSIHDVVDWKRGGAETYIARSAMRDNNGYQIDILGKAFVGWGTGPEMQQVNWERRRRLLRDLGVRVPKVYREYPAMSIEEFIPDKFPDKRLVTEIQAFQVGQIMHVLKKLGFSPVALPQDLRLLDSEVTMVDFGNDLGDPNNANPNWVAAVRAQVPTLWKKAFNLGFESGFQRLH